MNALSQTQFDEAVYLADVLTPFVGAKFNLKRDAKGYVIPRSIFVDVSTIATCFRDARVEAVTGTGVQIVTLGGATVIDIAWDDITRVVVRGADGSQVVAFDRWAESAKAPEPAKAPAYARADRNPVLRAPALRLREIKAAHGRDADFLRDERVEWRAGL